LSSPFLVLFLCFFCLQISPFSFNNCTKVPKQIFSPVRISYKSRTGGKLSLATKATWLPIKGAFTAMCQNDPHNHGQLTNPSIINSFSRAQRATITNPNKLFQPLQPPQQTQFNTNFIPNSPSETQNQHKFTEIISIQQVFIKNSVESIRSSQRFSTKIFIIEPLFHPLLAIQA
jgi:hypothetical protein